VVHEAFVAVLPHGHFGTEKSAQFGGVGFAAKGFEDARHVHAAQVALDHGVGKGIIGETERQKVHALLGLLHQRDDEWFECAVFGGEDDLNRHAVDDERLLRQAGGGCGAELTVPHFFEFAFINRRQFGRADDDDVVVLGIDTVAGGVGRTGPHDLAVEDPEFVVHESRTVEVAAHFNAGVGEHGELSAPRLTVCLEPVFAVGHPAHVHAAVVGGDERLGDGGQVEFKRGDVDAGLGGVNVGNQFFFHRAADDIGFVEVDGVGEVDLPPVGGSSERRRRRERLGRGERGVGREKRREGDDCGWGVGDEHVRHIRSSQRGERAANHQQHGNQQGDDSALGFCHAGFLGHWGDLFCGLLEGVEVARGAEGEA